ncbi:MAG: HIT family protein [Stomatobaculum sp.]
MREENCIFCKIANGEIPSEAVWEDEEFKVILDLGPAAKGHALILPREHYRDLTEVPEALCGRVFSLAGKIGAAMKRRLGCAGFNVVQNNGTAAGQTVFHFHVHIIPRYENGPEMVSWEPGTADPAEQAKIAALLREEVSA